MGCLMLLALMQGTASAQRRNLINDASQLTSNAPDDQGGEGHLADLGRLIDGDVNTFWHSDYKGNYANNDLQIRLSETVKRGEYIYITVGFRNHDMFLDYPTRFTVQVSMDGNTWQKNCEWNVQYTGPGTLTTTPGMQLRYDCQYIRLVCENSFIANPTESASPIGWSFALSELQIATEHSIVDTSTGGPGDTQARYDGTLDGYTFSHTRSILDSHNRQDGNPNWQYWHVDGYDANGKWTRDQEALEQIGVKMPDFSYFDHAHDSRIVTGERQAAHIQEHDVYALPGSIVLLEPYSDLVSSTCYMENYIRWYDYSTDRRSPNLAPTWEDWLVMANDHGVYGGMGVVQESRYDLEINSVELFNSFAYRVNTLGETSLNVLMVGDIDFTDAKVSPVGTKDHPYTGRFNGNGHTIKNLKMEGTDCVGLFGYVAPGAVIKNLIIDSSCSFSGSSYVAPVASSNAPANADGKKILIENVYSACTSIASLTDAACIFGCNGNGEYQIEIVNCMAAGTVNCTSGRTTASGLAAWMGDNGNSLVQNSYSKALVGAGKDPDAPFARGTTRFINCFCTEAQSGVSTTSSYSVSRDRLDNRYWNTDATLEFVPNFRYDREGNRGLMTAAYYCAPAGTTVQETTIAADISQSYLPHDKANLDRQAKSMVEPALMVRHLFNIKDGAKQAESLSGSLDSNKAYIMTHRREASARAGADFQIRLDMPLPDENTFRSNLYYKDTDGTYKCIPNWEIKTFDKEGNELTNIFQKHAPYSTSFTRCKGGQAEQEHYFSYQDVGDNANGNFYRMIKCAAADAHEGTYVVRLYAKDAEGKDIHVCGTNAPLQIAEYEVTFLPAERASFVNDATLKADDTYRRHRKEYLTAKYGTPQAKVDYDEYLLLEGGQTQSNDYILNTARYGTVFDENELDGKAKMFMWPRQWENSNYGFGYFKRNDYAMYMVTNHSWAVPYQSAASLVTNKENFGKGEGLRDRLFYDTQGEQSGYFYYVNAASDPGVCATAHINQICAGSTVHVSAWVAEFSSSTEVANFILNFQALLKDGRTVTLHSFVTGYVDRADLGRWVHVYYSFVPDLSEFGITSDEVASYSVVLENNCISSSGADYAVDDIQVFVAKPTVYSQQMEPVCSEKISPKTIVYAPIDETLASNGLTEAESAADGRKVNLFYSFVDKKKYDEARAAGKDGVTAYDQAVLRYEYMPGEGTAQTFGKLSFSTHYDSNPEYQDSHVTSSVAMRRTIDGERCLCFNTFPQDESLKPGKEYYVAIYTEDDNIYNPTTHPGASEFNIEDDCSKTCIMRVRSSSVIKVNGVTQQEMDEITVCEHQQPTIQLDLWGMRQDGEGGLSEVERNAHFDWYAGAADDYYAESSNGMYLSDVMTYFREAYPEATSLDVEPRDHFTEAMRQYLLSLTATVDASGRAVTPKVLLYRSSYTFPPVSARDEYVYVTAVPINKTYGQMLVCTIPTEVRLRVYNHAPLMTDGFAQIDSYPESMTDVPLRISLGQLKAVSAPVAEAKTYASHLEVPVKQVVPVSEGSTDLRPSSDDNVYLTATNDPAYRTLQDASSSTDDSGLMPVGVVQRMQATRGREDNLFDIVFYSGQFQFHEGYYYTLKFGFDEVVKSIEQMPCSGEAVLTLKVVPQYQKWTGAKNTNWNNDANWARVSSTELYRSGSVSQDEYVTDGLNANALSYAPLDFTCAIVEAQAPSPRLYAMPTTRITLPSGKAYDWPSTPDVDDMGNAQPSTTEAVQYDMAAVTGTGLVGCRPWYANACSEVNFRPSAEMLGQQHLAYGKAWVEMALKPGRWYTLASPLQSVVAGDMYLPTDGARQESELFQPITFDTKAYDRFSPAVYQRAWNHATATVYEVGGGNRNVAVKTAWSRVYNDVDEDYSHGEGFSLKVDVSRQPSAVDEVLLRLPKDDSSYCYYSDYTTGNTTGHLTPIDRGTTAYRLMDVAGTLTARSAGESKYFLIANPFMAHLDMKEFLTRNQDKLNPKYWILTGDSQQAAVMDASAGHFVGNMAQAGYVAPLQSFFVEAKSEANELTLSYDESMMQVDVATDDDGGMLLAPAHTRATSNLMPRAAHGNALRITALAGDKEVSQALLRVQAGAHRGYDESEDVALIDDAMQESLPRVYTVSGGMATDINTLPAIDSTEVGLLASASEAVTLRFEGVDAEAGVMLHDRLTGQSLPLTEGMLYPVTGMVTDRLYLVGSGEHQAATGISMSVQDGVLQVMDHAGTAVTASVYAADGALHARQTGDKGHVAIHLGRGVYVVEAQGEQSKESRTIVVP